MRHLITFLNLVLFLPHINLKTLSKKDDETCPPTEFEYCTLKKESCQGSGNSSCECDPSFCECLKMTKTENQYCSVYAKEECAHIENVTELINRDFKSYSSKLPNMDELIKNCFDTEEFNKTINSSLITGLFSLQTAKIAAFQYTSFLEPINSQCDLLLAELSDALKDIDDGSNCPVSFPVWHCNWELGVFGMVITRRIGVCLAKNQLVELNHCCAIRRNCYVYQKDKQTCDDGFRNCNIIVVESVKNPANITQFLQMMEGHIEATGDRAYSMAPQHELILEAPEGHSYQGYRSNPHEKEKMYSVILYQRNTNLGEHGAVIDEFYANCRNWTIFGSSCVFTNDLAIDSDTGSLANCFGSMRPETQQCKKAVAKLIQTFQKNIPTWTSSHSNKRVCMMKMRCLLLVILLHLSVLYVKIESKEIFNNTSKLEEVENDCPQVADLLDYCSAEHSSCVKMKTSAINCSVQLERCIGKEKVQDRRHCQQIVEAFLRNFKDPKTSSAYQTPETTVSIWANDVKSAVELLKVCDPKVTPFGISFEGALQNIKLLNRMVSNCSKEKHQFDDQMIKMDKKSSLHISVPFDRFHCGWSLGYIGIVYFRQLISTSCGQSSIKINKCCAAHKNCYLLEKYDRDHCDQKYETCQEQVVDSMSVWKASCGVFHSESIKSLQIMLEDFDVISRQKIKTEIKVFDGHSEQGITAHDISEFRTSDIKVHTLRSTIYISSEILHIFNVHILKSGWKKRIIIDSCGLMFEECQRYEKKNACLRKLVTCLSDIDNTTKEFNEAVRNFDESASAYLDNEITMNKIGTMVQDKIDSFYFTLAWQYLAFFFGCKILVFVAKEGYKKMKHTPPVQPPENHPLTELQLRQD